MDISFDRTEFQYEPYPVGISRSVLPQSFYDELLASWPETGLFQYMERLGHKYSLSQINNSKKYHAFIRGNHAWRQLHGYFKSDEFIRKIVLELYLRCIDIGYGGPYLAKEKSGLSLKEKLKLALKLRPLRSRFEFSMLPAVGGYIKPHTDSPQKMVTLVLAFVGSDEWNPAWGGGTEMLKPRDITKNFNFMNKQYEFDDVETIHAFPFEPNQCVTFIKTFNSWHAVRPLCGSDKNLMRRTLTINIET